MNTEEFQARCPQLAPLVTGDLCNTEEIVSALEALVTNPNMQQSNAEDVVIRLQRKYVLATATPGTTEYQNLHIVLKNHYKATQIYAGIARLWNVEAAVAQSCYVEEDQLFNPTISRGYMPSTPYERLFVTRIDKEVGGLINQQQREKMRDEYIKYCKEREAEYKLASQ